MPNLYIHHVAQTGEKDLSKTVFASKTLDYIEQKLDLIENRAPYLDMLKSKFPNGSLNIWGIPEGGRYIIKNMREGDYVLLLGALSKTISADDNNLEVYDGEIVALAKVRVFLPIELYGLSQSLWGSNNFPYIFYFETIRLHLAWSNLKKFLNYGSRYNPRGQFLSVDKNKLQAVGGVENLINLITATNENAHPEEDVDLSETQNEIQFLRRNADNLPNIENEKERERKNVSRTVRSAAFAIEIKNLYDNHCAICDSNLHTPSGIPEIQAAHVYPVSSNGSDDLRNGIALCRIHHWAFDAGWLSLKDDLTVIARADIPKVKQYEFIYSYEGKSIRLPSDSQFKPHPVFLREHRKKYNFSEES